MLVTGNKTRLTAMAALTAAALGAFAGARGAAADTFLSGFNSDLSSSLGVNWEVFGPSWSTRFGPQLTEGTGALEVTHNPTWQVGIKLPAGEAWRSSWQRATRLNLTPLARTAWRGDRCASS